MDIHQQEAIKKYKDNYNLFLYLLQNKEGLSDTEMLRLLKDNHSMARSLLIDMGVTFHEVDTIRSLNQRVRALEAEQSSPDMSTDKVSIFINQIKDKTIEDLEAIGIYSSIGVSMNPNLDITLSLLSLSKREPDRSSFRVQKEFDEYKEKVLSRYDNFMKNFEVVKWNGNDFMPAYTTTNLSLIKDCIEKSVGIEIGSFEYTLGNVYEGEKPNTRIVPYISQLNFKFWTLPSSRSMNDVFKNRY